MNELVSIIVPIYNVEEYLDQCVKSIVSQTYKYIEIILINDGSTDKSGEICEKYKDIDQRVIVIHKKNSGVSSARNLGLDIAKGKYICFVDSDDYINENMIEKMIKNIKQSSSDICICGYNIITNNSRIKISDNSIISKKMNSNEVLEIIFEDNRINGFLWNKMFSRKVLNNIKLDENIDICEDLYFICNILSMNRNIYYFSEPLYNYRNNYNSATMRVEKLFLYTGELKYCSVYSKISDLFKFNDNILDKIRLRNIKTIMESYILVLKQKYKNENVDKYIMAKLKENKKIYMCSNIKIKYKFAFTAIYILLVLRNFKYDNQ